MQTIKDILADIPTFQPSIMKRIDLEEGKAMEYFLAIANKLHPGFVIDNDNKNTAWALIRYFSGINNPLDTSKGIFLHGNIGSGKTLIMKTLKYLTGHIFQVNSFRYVESIEIENRYMKCGEAILDDYTGGNYLIDDLGFEKGIVNYYGTKAEILTEILTKRYTNWLAGKFTHVTTNLTASKLEERYGQRVLSRFNEMMNDVYLPGGDRRK